MGVVGKHVNWQKDTNGHPLALCGSVSPVGLYFTYNQIQREILTIFIAIRADVANQEAVDPKDIKFVHVGKTMSKLCFYKTHFLVFMNHLDVGFDGIDPTVWKFG